VSHSAELCHETARPAPAAPAAPAVHLRRTALEDLEVGQELAGVVVDVSSFGAFVDVGAMTEGMVHISQISQARVHDLDEYLQLGAEVKVWVAGVSGDRLSLTMAPGKEVAPSPPRSAKQRRAGLPPPLQPVAGKLPARKSKPLRNKDQQDLAAFVDVPPEQWLQGKVSAVQYFGAFVTITPPGGGPCAEGLVHISEIGDGYVDHPGDELEVGQEVAVRVAAVDERAGKLWVSMRAGAGAKAKPYRDGQDVSGFRGVFAHKWLRARVTRSTSFGVFADVEPPGAVGAPAVEGLIHAKRMGAGYLDDPGRGYSPGQEVWVRVEEVHEDTGRLDLTTVPLPGLPAPPDA